MDKHALRIEYVRLLEEKLRRSRTRRLFAYQPYQKQREFHAAGTNYTERLLMAGNQLGKTLCMAAESAMHLTGLYPDWWKGRRWHRPIVMWAASKTMEVSRDAGQRLLIGRDDARGTGMIPADCLLETPAYPNVNGAVTLAKVKHKSGGSSLVIFKSYDQGREKFQGDSVDLVWFDEEPKIDVYTEGLTRTNATKGMVAMTFTPLLGRSKVVQRFLSDKNPSRNITIMTIMDVEHYTDEERQRIIDSYEEYERDARVNGIPTAGDGVVFPVSESVIAEDAIAIPDHWPRICGIDFGWDHPTAAAWLAWDRDSDAIHIYDVYRRSKETPAVHAAAIKARGDWIPVSWPHDGLQHDKGSGEQLAEQYRKHGLNMLHERATFIDGGNGVEAGVMDMLDRMRTGRFKVARHLNDFFEEFRLYHREDGKIVKENDDILSAVRYGCMMLRHAALKRPERQAWERKLVAIRSQQRSYMSA